MKVRLNGLTPRGVDTHIRAVKVLLNASGLGLKASYDLVTSFRTGQRTQKTLTLAPGANLGELGEFFKVRILP